MHVLFYERVIRSMLYGIFQKENHNNKKGVTGFGVILADKQYQWSYRSLAKWRRVPNWQTRVLLSVEAFRFLKWKKEETIC